MPADCVRDRAPGSRFPLVPFRSHRKLFTGPSGSGKALAAEAIASELSREVIRIDSRAVVGKHIGETEKNVNAIFADAADAGAVLFFDEADALFGRRTETSDSHDRYQDVGIDYLVKRIEEYPGFVILATNRPEIIDEAFVRRTGFIVDFR